MSNVKFILSAVAFTLASGAALAQEAVPAQWNNAYTPDVSVSHSGKTRAEVLAELQAARADGSLARYDHDSYSPASLIAPATRVASQPAARDAASLAATKPAVAGGVTREQVRAELQAARRSGEVNPFDNDPYVNVAATVAAPQAAAATTFASR